MKCVLLYIFRFVLLIGWVFDGFSQNLVPNPSFEAYIDCPSGMGSPGADLECIPWQCGSWGSADYFNECATNPLIDVPYNFAGYQYARTGMGYTGGYVSGNFREYIQVQLLSPLLAGYSYGVSFYVSLADNACGIANIGLYLSSTPPPSVNSTPIEVTPQIESNIGYLSDKTDWVLISGCYQAQGGESWITIGNFFSAADSPIDPDCIPPSQFSYYYYDDVSIIPMGLENNLNLDLGGPVSVCDSFEIDPGLTGVNYFWEDGSTMPTLTVTESGTYTLTTFLGCESGLDSITVTILGVHENVDLGPPMITICNGDTFTIALDPTLGEYEWQDGSDNANYAVTTAGVYQVYFDDGCDVTTDQISVSVMDLPVFTLGDDVNICPGDGINFSFDPVLGDFEWQDHSISPQYLIDIGGVYQLTISNMCGETTDEIEVFEILPPDIDLGPDQLQLCDGQYLDIDLPPGIAVYHWQDGSNSFSYSISMPGEYAVTASNQCGSISDTILVQYLDSHIKPDLGPDVNLCPGEYYILSANISGVNYLWQDLSTADSLIVSASGLYTLQISNACSSSSDTVIVSFNAAAPQVDLPSSLDLCLSDTIVVDAGISGVQFLWNDGSQSSTLLVSSPGLYSLTVSNACGVDADTVSIIDAGPPPTVSLGPDISFCSHDINLLTPVSSGVISWLWQDSSSLPTFTVSSPGQIIVQANNICGTNYDTLIASLLPPIPLLQLSADTSLCPGETLTLSISIPNVDILWSDGSVSTDFNVVGPGLVFASITNQCGSSSDSVDISLLPPAPILNLGADQSLCLGDVITLSPGVAGVSYLWQNGSTSSTFNVAQSDSIILTISNACGFDTDTIIVLENSIGPQVDLGPDVVECEGAVVILHSGIFGVNYLWQDGSNASDYSTSVSGTFILQVSNSCGMDADTVDVDISGVIPSPVLGRDTLLCEGQTIVLFSNADPGTSLVWQDGSNAPNYTVSSSGIYSLSTSNHCGSASDTINVEINGTPPLADLGRDTVLCFGESIMLFANADPETNIVWQDSSSTPAYNVTGQGSYSLLASNHCGTSSDTIDVSFEALPSDFNLGRDTTLCPGQSIVLTSPQTDVNIFWQDGSHGQNMIADNAQLYFLRLSNSCGTKSDSLNVDVDQRSPAISIDAEIEWCEGDFITLDAGQSFPAEYLWSTGSAESSINVYTPGLYAVSVITTCQNADQEIEIIPGDNCAHDFYIPTIFSPNGDNINDFFSISFSSGVELNSVTCSVFDRWGNMVYNTYDPSFAWDGRFRNDPLNPGVYVYRIEFTYSFGGKTIKEQVNGDITLIR